jgi:GT2 family glycosyltransferase
VSHAELPRATLVIGTRNRPSLLRATVESVLDGRERPAEIVVVDQSDEPSFTLAELSREDCAVRVIAASEPGLSRARNEGAAAASTELLVFADDDMLADREWFGRLVRALAAAEPKTVVTGAVEAAPGESWRSFFPATQSHTPGAVFEGRLDRDVLAGGHMAITRSALEDVGGFDPRLGPGAAYPAAEDNDLGFRLLEAGYRIAYVADAVLYHRAWRAGWRYPLVRFSYGRGKGGFYAKHPAQLRSRALRDVTHRMRRFPRQVIRRPSLAAGDVAYVAGILVGSTRWWLREHR